MNTKMRSDKQRRIIVLAGVALFVFFVCVLASLFLFRGVSVEREMFAPAKDSAYSRKGYIIEFEGRSRKLPPIDSCGN